MRTLIESKFFRYISILLIIAIFILGFLNHSYFEMICSVCAMLCWLVSLRLYSASKKEESVQKQQCKPVGFVLLLPSIGLIITGVFLLFGDFLGVASRNQYYSIGLAGLLSVCMTLQLLSGWKNKTIADRFLKQSIIAATSVPMSLLVVTILDVTSTDNMAEMGCLSTIGFGVFALLIALNMILVSSLGYKSTVGSIKAIRDVYRKNKLVITRVSIVKDVFLVVAKTVLSIVAASFFMFSNALYSAGMGIARFVAIKMYTQDTNAKIRSYRTIGIIISAASICYVLYSVRLFFGGSSGVYNMNIALMIALYTFVEFGVNIKEAIRLRGSKALEAKALRAVSFAATLICFVLTQTAIMSFSAEGDNSFTNALSGVVFGGLAALIGLYVIIDSFRQEKVVGE